jgi:site-specific DNA recombinase
MVAVEPKCRCIGKAVLGAALDDTVWRDCVEFVRNPGAALAQAQRELRTRLDRATDTGANRRALIQQIAEKDAERERVLTMYRRNRITIIEAETHLDSIATETAEIRRLLEALRAQEALAEAMEMQLTNAAVVLGKLRDGIEAAEAQDNFALRRQVVELLVSGITVTTTGRDEHGKRR